MKKELFVLGSGESVSRLTEAERAYINNAPVKLAVNKFGAFYDKAGIVPTHIYFVDAFSESSVNMLRHIIKKVRKDNLKNIVFIVRKNIRLLFIQNPFLYLKWKVLKVLRKEFKEMALFHVPKSAVVRQIKPTGWLEGGEWAKSLDDYLFHYRGSLTTVLNYISVCFPGYTIKLIGTDFNSSKYFYEEELKQLKFDATDWTTNIIKKENKHFSAVSYEGTTMFDKFDYILENLEKSDNKIYCCNAESLLVTGGYIKFAEVIS